MLMPRARGIRGIHTSLFAGRPGTKRKFGTSTTATIAKTALRIAKSNETIEHTTFAHNPTGTTDTPLGPIDFLSTGLPFVKYLQPPDVDSDPGSQTILYIRGNVHILQDLQSNRQDQWRFEIVVDRRPGGVTLDVARAYDVSTALEIATYANIDFSNRRRYKQLYTRGGIFDDDTNTSRMFHLNVRVGLVSQSNGVQFDIARMNKNALYLIYWTDATTNLPKIQYRLDLVSKTT